MTDRSPQYIHGTDADEQRRLTMMNSIINEPALRELKLRPGQRVLDGARGTIEATSSLTDSNIDAGVDVIRAWQQLPDAALWYAICWAEGMPNR